MNTNPGIQTQDVVYCNSPRFLAILGPLHFHRNFRIGYFHFYEQGSWNFDRDFTEPINCWPTTAIQQYSLPVQEHGGVFLFIQVFFTFPQQCFAVISMQVFHVFFHVCGFQFRFLKIVVYLIYSILHYILFFMYTKVIQLFIYVVYFFKLSHYRLLQDIYTQLCVSVNTKLLIDSCLY